MPPSSDGDKAWNEMLGKTAGPSKPMAQPAPAPTEAAPAAPKPGTPPIASAAKWGAVLILGVVVIVAIAWVLISNRSRPTITNAPPPASENGAPAAATPSPATPPTTGGSLLDINTATAGQLEHLPGIGPSLAARIVADRTKHGRYTSVDQLDRVQGIGPKTLDKLRPYLTVK